MVPLSIRNPKGINTGNALESTSCPIEAWLLKSLYDKNMSCRNIAAYLIDRFNRSIDISTVHNWLLRIGVQTRTYSEARIIVAKDPAEYESLKEHMRRIQHLANASVRKRGSDEGRRRAVETYKANCLRKRIKRVCSNCGKEFTVIPSRLAQAEKRGQLEWFDNQSCKVSFYRRLKVYGRGNSEMKELFAEIRSVKAARREYDSRTAQEV